MIQGKNYKERSNFQLDEWVKGNPIHNDVDDECCPDFSCCDIKALADEEMRKTFKALKLQVDKETGPSPSYSAMMGMLMEFMGKMIAKHFPDKKVHVTCDDDISVKKDLN